MTSLHKNRYECFRMLVVAALAACSLVAARQAPAADLAEQVHSLQQVPADAAFYSASLRFAEQWDTFENSKAYGKLMEIPVIQIVKMGAVFQWQQATQPAIAQVREYIESPAGQDAVGVVKEMFSDEIFAYGGSNIAETIKVLMEANSLARSARLDAVASGEDPGKAVTEKMLERFKEQLGKGITVPTATMGFRIKDKERAKRELDEVHSLLRNVLDEHQPDLAAHLQREQIGGHEFLTFRLDGSMIPWDQLREQAHDLDDDQFNEIKEALSKQTIAVALGVVDEFVLLSVGATTDHLEKIGQGPTLADQAALKPIQQHAGERVVAISYLSKDFTQSLGSPQKTIDDIAGAAEEAMVQAKVDEEDRKTILDDIRALDISKFMPVAGDTSMVAFLTSRGYEAYQYTSTKQQMMDSSKPLSILNHVGGTPLLMIASHSKNGIDDYTKIVDWLKRVAGHAEQIAEKKADSDDWEKYQKIREQGIELLERLDKANREQMFPALADGQSALVIDFTAKSQKWFEHMPPAKKPLPMLELALVTSVSDAEKLHEGLKTYIDVGKDAFKLAKEMHGEDMPDVKLPEPVISDLDGGGKLYTYPLPKKWGLDPQVAVSAGLTSSFGAVSLMPLTTERLLKDKPLEIDTSLKLDRPAAIVTHIEFAKMIDAARPWINYGLDIATGKIKPHKGKEAEESDDSDAKPPEPPSPEMLKMGMVIPQLQQFLDVASAMKSATSVSYEENGMWVTHSETHLEDLK